MKQITVAAQHLGNEKFLLLSHMVWSWDCSWCDILENLLKNLIKCLTQRTVKLGYSRKINVEMDNLDMILRSPFNKRQNEKSSQWRIMSLFHLISKKESSEIILNTFRPISLKLNRRVYPQTQPLIHTDILLNNPQNDSIWSFQLISSILPLILYILIYLFVALCLILYYFSFIITFHHLSLVWITKKNNYDYSFYYD